MGKSKKAVERRVEPLVRQSLYLERNLDVCKAYGIVAGIDAIAARAMKRKGMPLWLFGMLGAEKRRAKDLIAPLVERRDEMANNVLSLKNPCYPS